MFRDYSNLEEATDPSDLDCGVLARLFPRDLFYELEKHGGKTYKVSLENVADESASKFYEIKSENPNFRNPLFINWMVW